jgi:hypothetical protein
MPRMHGNISLLNKCSRNFLQMHGNILLLNKCSRRMPRMHGNISFLNRCSIRLPRMHGNISLLNKFSVRFPSRACQRPFSINILNCWALINFKFQIKLKRFWSVAYNIKLYCSQPHPSKRVVVPKIILNSNIGIKIIDILGQHNKIYRSALCVIRICNVADLIFEKRRLKCMNILYKRGLRVTC